MVNKMAEEYLMEPYERILIPEETGEFSASILEFPGCYAFGNSPNEAYANLEDVAKEWIESEFEQGREIPPPIANYEFSGRIVLRLPRSLHKLAARMAKRDQTSLNQFLVSAIAARVGAEDLYSRIAEKISKPVTYITTNILTILKSSENRLPIEGLKFLAEPSQTVGTRESLEMGV